MLTSGVEIKVAPSILAADFSRLGEQVAEASNGGADYIHVDMMDGHFVPPITIGAQVVSAIRPWSEVPIEVHMMVEEPTKFIPELVDAGADTAVVHVEACKDLRSTVDKIVSSGIKAGVALSPSTSELSLQGVLSNISLVVAMTVEPGWGGQPFIHKVLDKVTRIRSMIDDGGYDAELEVDGGINIETAGYAVKAGAGILVAGTAIYGSGVPVDQAIANIRQSVHNIN